MSADSESSADEVCANCGKASVDEIKLKMCTACKLVKYCSVDCQKKHRPQHKKACKKRLAELRDDRLFTQPDSSHLGECPLCCLPLSLKMTESTLYTCCSKIICHGCQYANSLRELEKGLDHKCPFCREPDAKTREESEQRSMERIKANDPVAICGFGKQRFHEGDYEEAFKYYSKAAELGFVDAHYEVGSFYEKGRGVEKDMKKYKYHMEEAAIGGHHHARYNLGYYEWDRGRDERAMKHFIIGATLGDDRSLTNVRKLHEAGVAKKEDYDAALRGYQTAADATKSEQRQRGAAAVTRRW
jgi:tetratricopeptide (TPR) repeat protein